MLNQTSYVFNNDIFTEINRKVAELAYPGHMITLLDKDTGTVIVRKGTKRGTVAILNYCTNPLQAWPIIRNTVDIRWPGNSATGAGLATVTPDGKEAVRVPFKDPREGLAAALLAYVKSVEVNKNATKK